MGWVHGLTFRFFWETGAMGDNKILRICDCLHPAKGVSRFYILDFRFTPQINLGALTII